MGELVDLSVGAPSAPEVVGGVGDAVPEAGKAKRTRSSSTRSSSTSTSTPPPTQVPSGLDGLDDALPAVTMDQVRVVVMSAGLMLSMTLGDADVADHWRFTELELAALVPPLTTVINRRPALRRAVLRSDEATIALVLAGYAGRNLDSWRGAKKHRDDQAEVESGREGEADGAARAAGAGGDGADRAAGGPDGPGRGVPRPSA